MKAKVRTFSGTTSNEITQREIANRALARKAAAEGFVLLKNEGHFLPAPKGGKIALYGAGAVKTIKGGTGSGDVNERDYVTIAQGMKNAGYEVTTEGWLDSYVKIYDQAREDWKAAILKKAEKMESPNAFFEAYSSTPFFMPCGEKIDVDAAKADGADTAVFVMARIAGENKDRFDKEGDYFISEEERVLLAQVCESYKDVVLVINTGGLMDLAFADTFDNIRSIVQYVQAGQEGGNAFADVFTGAVTPSGKMTDTWAKTYNDYPGAEVYSYKSGDLTKERYEEGIFVGYRYFDTFLVPVRYGFGYGMSYTDFVITAGKVSVSNPGTMDPKVSVEVTVKNTGDTYAGKEVVQIYVSCPQGELVKEFRRLAGFGKTKLLAPGEEQQMTITFPLYQLASYSEDQAAWILEPGKYGIWVGNELNTSVLSGALELDQEAVMVQCENICPLKEELKEIMPFAKKVQARELAWHEELKAKGIVPVVVKAADIPTEKVDYQKIPEVLPGRAGEIVEQMSEEQLVQMATGDPGKDQVVGCHDGHWLCILDCNLKSFQIDLTEGSLGQDRIRTHTVVFLVVACIMFDRCSASRYFLYTQCHGSSHHTGQQRIFGIIFKVSSAQRISVNVHTRCQPEGDTEQFHLVADHFTEFTNKVQIPGLCQKSSYRNRGTVLIIRSSSLFF